MEMEARNAKHLFLEAVERVPPEQWPQFLDSACSGDDDLRQQVLRLLDAHGQIGSFMAAPAGGMAINGETVDLPLQERVGTTIGRYKLLEQIGEGGMGVVFVAEQIEPVRRRVALKVIKPGMDTRQVIARFQAERQALAMMDHPNIAKVLDAGTTDAGRPYFVMELVRGLPITGYCNQAKLNPTARLKIFMTVCQAVQHAHQKGIIHRDLKPSNVLVTLHDGQPVAKVIDFGVAKAINQRLTEQTVYTAFAEMIGTPLYMSPEQAELSGLDVDTRSDIYSLGVLLYELLVGQTPFERDTLLKAGLNELRRIIREVEPAIPSQRVSALGPAAASTISQQLGIDQRQLSHSLRGELDWIVMKALEKDRNRRYETPSAFAADIERHLNDEPVRACPPSRMYLALKFARRNKTAAIVTAVIASVILMSSVFSAVRYASERAARHEADQQKAAAIRHAKQAEAYAADARRERGEALRQKTQVELERDAARQNLYCADVRLAFAEMGLGHTSRARELLLSHLSSRSAKDHRGWEWHYLLGQSHEAEQALYGHQGEVTLVDWSPDGKWIASTGVDCSAKVWDATTWKLVRTFDQGPTLKQGMQWSPDSTKLAWGSAEGEAALRIWDRSSDKVAVLLGHRGSMWAVAWSHDGTRLATGSIHASKSIDPGNVRIWDVDTLQCIAELTSECQPFALSWSADDRLLAVADPNEKNILWDVSSGRQLPDTVMDACTCVAWHPTQSTLLAAGNAYQECLVWDHSKQEVVSRWTAHQGLVTDIKWSRDGSSLITAGKDGMVKVWDSKQARELRTLAAHTGAVNAVAWQPSGKQFASGGTDGVIRIWPLGKQMSPLTINTDNRGDLNLAWTADSSTLLLASGPGGAAKITAFDANSGEQLQETTLSPDPQQQLVSFRYLAAHSEAPPGEPIQFRLATVPARGMLAAAVPPTRTNSIRNHAHGVLSTEESKIAYMSGDARSPLHIRDVNSKHAAVGPVVIDARGIAWSPNGSLLAVVGRGELTDNGFVQHAGWVHIFDSDRAERRRKLRIGADRVPGSAVAWSHDGRRIAAANEQGLCEVWEAESGRKLLSERIHTSLVYDLAWSPDDLRIASGGINEQVHLWNSSTGQQFLALDPVGNPIRHIRWSPDGRKLAAVGHYGVIKVWDATEGFELPQRSFWPGLTEKLMWKEYERLLKEERWPAIRDLLQDTVARKHDSEDPFYYLALINLQLDDEAGYRQTCQQMLAEFAETDRVDAAYKTAWACVYRPDAVLDYDPIVVLVQRVMDFRMDARRPASQPYFSGRELLGATCLRAGRHSDALRYLQMVNAAPANQKYSAARIAYFTAMAHHHLGQATDAQEWLARANVEADKELNSLKQPHWTLQLTLRLLRTETTQLIYNKRASNSSSVTKGALKN